MTTPTLTLKQRRSQINKDLDSIYVNKNAQLFIVQDVLTQYMPRYATKAITNACEEFCKPFHRCPGFVQIDSRMSSEQLNAAMQINVKARLDNGMVQCDKEEQVRNLLNSLKTLVRTIQEIYAGTQQVAACTPAPTEKLASHDKTPVKVKRNIVSPDTPQPVLKQRSTHTAANARHNATVDYSSVAGSSRNGLTKKKASHVEFPPSLFCTLPNSIAPPNSLTPTIYTSPATQPIYAKHSSDSAPTAFFPAVHASFPFLSPTNIFPPLQPVRQVLAPVANLTPVPSSSGSLPRPFGTESDTRLRNEEQIRRDELSDYYSEMRRKAQQRGHMLAAAGGVVDGFFSYNPHTTTVAMDAQRLQNELMMIDHHESVAQNNLHRQQKIWRQHDYNEWSDMRDSMDFSSGLFQEPQDDPRFRMHPPP